MWEHLASGLIGTNDNQTFNIYNGCGRNGKSMLVKFMILILGDYKGSVPLQYITQKRPTAGAASPDIAALKGVRYAVIQEPEKAAPLNEGIMKELTGGDEITARKLFSDIIKFTPQFSLVVCTNHLFDIKSNDDGTWRRIRICDFKSKFVAKPSKKEDDFEFLIDKKLDEKLNKWKYMFLQKLVEVAFKTGGLVEDCDPVLELGKKYRKKQDFFTEYFEERIIKAEVDTMMFGKQEVFDDFRQWFNENHGKNTPKGQELYEFLNKKIGVYKKKGWWGYKIIYNNEVIPITENIIE
jgi:P4 family phage/plasmid primase-like protien